MRIFPVLTFIAFALIFISCKKNHPGTGTDLSGTWIKGTNAGDTLQFLKKNNKDILRYNVSFNAPAQAYTEVEYRYENGKLAIKLYAPSTEDFYPIGSFNWKQVGIEFEIRGIELFSFLSSTQTYYTYRKI